MWAKKCALYTAKYSLQISKCQHTSLWNILKITFVYIPTPLILSDESNYLEAVKLTVANMHSPKLQFSLKSYNSIMGNKCREQFSCGDRLPSLIFERTSAKLSRVCLSTSLWGTNGVPWKRGLVRLAAQWAKDLGSAKCCRLTPLWSHTLLKRYTQGLKRIQNANCHGKIKWKIIIFLWPEKWKIKLNHYKKKRSGWDLIQVIISTISSRSFLNKSWLF